MTSDNDFQKRIQYKGDLKVLLEKVCHDYELGAYSHYEIITVGYEDLNIILTTDKNTYFTKIFADFRNRKNCERYVSIIQKAIEAGVQHPSIYKSPQGYLYEATLDNAIVHLCVLQCIDGKSFYSLQEQPTMAELQVVAHQAAIINQMAIKPDPVYDSWAIVNILAEFEVKQQYLSEEDLKMVAPLIEDFRKIDLTTLPHCFVHGDLIKTNVMRSTNGKLYVFDFSVANIYPRIQELAVLFCDLFFNEKDPSNFKECYELGLSEYQKTITLTDEEIKILPLFIKAAHAMHIICPNFECAVNGNNSKENGLWLELGRTGLKFSLNYWQ
jgi:Ser/Thr protein kinase RdoA (MazF antagonist)